MTIYFWWFQRKLENTSKDSFLDLSCFRNYFRSFSSLPFIYFSKCSLWKRDNWINFDQSFFLLRSTKKLAIFKKINNMHTKLLFVDKWFVFKGCNHLKLARMLLYLVFPVKPILKVTFFEWMLVWGELKDHRKILSIKPE